MNGYAMRDPSSRASRESFLAYLHDYLVQNGCMQTANALTKEASFGPLGEGQDSFFYDWWCSLLSLHNFAGPPQQDVPRLPGANWAEGPVNAVSNQNINTADAEQQTFKRPNQVRAGSIQSTTSTSNSAHQHQQQQPQPQSQHLQQPNAPIARPQPKLKSKARKGSPHNKPATKGSPILVPGVAPLVVARNASSAPTPTPTNGARHGSVSSQVQQVQQAQRPQPGTPQWDNNQLVADAFQRETPSQRPVPHQNMAHPPQMAETRGGVPPSYGQVPQAQHGVQKGRQSGGTPVDPSQQFFQHQQLLQQQNFLQLQQQGQAPIGGQAAVVVGQNRFMGVNGMTAAQVGAPPGVVGAPGSIADRTMGEIVGKSNEPSFLDYMMAGNSMPNGGLNFSSDAALDGMGYDPMVSRTENEYGSNGEIFVKNEYGHSRDPEFGAKMVDHAGMTHAQNPVENFGTTNVGLDMNSSVPFVGLEDNPMFNDGSFKMGPNFALGGDAGANGDFFSEVPLSMSL